jgi:hypothetical protein
MFELKASHLIQSERFKFELSGLGWLNSEQSALNVICQQIDKAIGPHAHIPNASRPTLEQTFFAHNLFPIEA